MLTSMTNQRIAGILKSCWHGHNDPRCSCGDGPVAAALNAVMELGPGVDAMRHLELTGWVKCRETDNPAAEGRWVAMLHPALPRDWEVILTVGPKGATRFWYWA